MSASEQRILCIVLHYGAADVTWDCLDSLGQEHELDIWIADNDPAQNLELPDRFTDRVSLFRTGGSAGFAEANNRAVEAARAANHSAVLLLNNDTLVEAAAIERMAGLLAQDRVGMVGPCMPYADDPERIWACGGVIDRLRVSVRGHKTLAGDEPYEVDYLPGAAILVRLEVWDKSGGMSEKYFLAFEEAELAMQARADRYRVMVHPGARILHKVGMSSDKQPMYVYNSIRNRLRFGATVWGKLPGFLLASFWCLNSARGSLRHLALWVRALGDELRGKPLDRAALQRIRQHYGSE